MNTSNGTHREAINVQIRQAVVMIHKRIKESALGMQEAEGFWDGKDEGYFEGFGDGLNAAKLHIEDAMQAFVDGELIEPILEVQQ